MSNPNMVSEDVTDAAENAFKATVGIITAVAASEEIQSFSQRKSLRDRMGNDFSIRLGFGLHIG